MVNLNIDLNMSEEDMPLLLEALMLLKQEKNEGVVEIGYVEETKPKPKQKLTQQEVRSKFGDWTKDNQGKKLIDNPAPRPDTPIEQAIWWTENRRWNNGAKPKLDVIEFTKMWESCERFSEFLMKSGYSSNPAKLAVKRHRENGIDLKLLYHKFKDIPPV